MARISSTDISRVFSGLPSWLLAVTVLLPALGFVHGWISEAGAGPTNTRFVLSALAGAQASVLAIVFSVTVIGVQLVGTRYSSRMVSLFTNAPILVFTFGLFLGSIGVDIGLLYNVPSAGARLHTAGLHAAIGLSLSTAIALFAFIRATIRQSTPEGIITAFVNDLTRSKYLRQVEQSVKDDLQNVHPLQPLYSMVMEALSNRRRDTAEIALRNFGTHAVSLLKEFSRRNTFENTDRQIARDLFKPVLQEQLQHIALHAEEQDESQLVSEATEWLYTLGEEGLDLSTPMVSRQAVRGLTGVIIRAPTDSGEYVANDNAWRKLGELLVDAAEYPQPEVVWSVASTVMNRGSQMLWRAHDGRRFQHSMTDLYGKIAKAHGILLDRFGDEIADVDMEWQYEHVPNDISNRDRVDCVFRLRKGLLRTTAAFIEYFLEEGYYPIIEGNFRNAWETVCVDASNSPARDYAIVLCQALIELAFIEKREQQDDGLNWVYTIGRVKYEGDPEIVDAAFERILSYDYEETEPGPFVAGASDDRRDTYYRNLIHVQKYQPLNSQLKFEESVKAIQEQANERWNYLRSSE